MTLDFLDFFFLLIERDDFFFIEESVSSLTELVFDIDIDLADDIFDPELLALSAELFEFLDLDDFRLENVFDTFEEFESASLLLDDFISLIEPSDWSNPSSPCS